MAAKQQVLRTVFKTAGAAICEQLQLCGTLKCSLSTLNLVLCRACCVWFVQRVLLI
jgi:hypothetical protein